VSLFNQHPKHAFICDEVTRNEATTIFTLFMCVTVGCHNWRLRGQRVSRVSVRRLWVVGTRRWRPALACRVRLSSRLPTRPRPSLGTQRPEGRGSRHDRGLRPSSPTARPARSRRHHLSSSGSVERLWSKDQAASRLNHRRSVDGLLRPFGRVGRIYREMILGKPKWRWFLQQIPEAGPGEANPAAQSGNGRYIG
jgi:hypothetical protein